MGLSSSQARLLSLTSRVHDIEYRAQRTEAQKLQLANESERVYETYLDALEKKKIVANLIDSNGEYYETPLTAKSVYTYQQLYEQYALKTAGGKVLVPENLHTLYKNTTSLSTYLAELGMNQVSQVYKKNEIPNEEYLTKYQRWESDFNGYQQEFSQWQTNTALYNKQYSNWVKNKPDEDSEKYWTTTTSTLGNDFQAAGGSCYDYAVNENDTVCYKHVLERIIDFSAGKGYDNDNSNGNYSHYEPSWYDSTNYTTSTGQTFKINFDNGAGCRANYETFSQVSEKIDKEEYCVASDTSDGCSINITSSSSEFDKLVSKYYLDNDGNLQLKSLKKWAIDLWYACDKYPGSSTASNGTTFGQTVAIFQNNLISNIVEKNEALYNADYAAWQAEEPVSPGLWTKTAPVLADYVGATPKTIDQSGYVDKNTFTDKNLAQWYINLWAKMNGSDETPEIHEEYVHDDETDNDVVLYSVEDIQKTDTTYTQNPDSGAIESDNYIVIPNDKLDDTNWIRNSIGEGFVIIQQWVENEKKFKDVSLGSCTRISEVPDPVDIKKAEAQYEADISKINKKDAQYDAALSAFDTERIALKNEIETLKTVAKDNVERTFKLFS